MNFALALAALLAQGAAPIGDTFEQRCKLCHAADGTGHTRKGKQLKAPDFTSAKWNKETADEEIYDAIKNGVPKTKMPAFKSKLSDDEIQALAVYVRKFGVRGQK